MNACLKEDGEKKWWMRIQSNDYVATIGKWITTETT
jgi:hypothetical protein